MRMAILCGTASLALAGLAEAQDGPSWTSPDCATLEADSLEAALLDCDRSHASSTEVEVLDETLPGGDPAPSRIEPTIDVEPEVEAAATRGWLERHTIGEPVEREEVQLLDEEDQPPDLPPPSDGARYAEIDGMIVELDPESYELLQLIRRSAGVAKADDPAVETIGEEDVEAELDEAHRQRIEAAREDEDRRERRDENEGRRREEGERAGLNIPNGHRPPPGSCRVWYPDRPPGQQPPPTSCNVEVPEGAVLIRG